MPNFRPFRPEIRNLFCTVHEMSRLAGKIDSWGKNDTCVRRKSGHQLKSVNSKQFCQFSGWIELAGGIYETGVNRDTMCSACFCSSLIIPNEIQLLHNSNLLVQSVVCINNSLHLSPSFSLVCCKLLIQCNKNWSSYGEWQNATTR